MVSAEREPVTGGLWESPQRYPTRGRAPGQEVRGPEPFFALSQTEDSDNLSYNLFFLQNETKFVELLWRHGAQCPGICQ